MLNAVKQIDSRIGLILDVMSNISAVIKVLVEIRVFESCNIVKEAAHRGVFEVAVDQKHAVVIL